MIREFRKFSVRNQIMGSISSIMKAKGYFRINLLSIPFGLLLFVSLPFAPCAAYAQDIDQTDPEALNLQDTLSTEPDTLATAPDTTAATDTTQALPESFELSDTLETVQDTTGAPPDTLVTADTLETADDSTVVAADTLVVPDTTEVAQDTTLVPSEPAIVSDTLQVPVDTLVTVPEEGAPEPSDTSTTLPALIPPRQLSRFERMDSVMIEGLFMLPADARTKWMSLIEATKGEDLEGYLDEGEFIIRQLAELLGVVGGVPPLPDSPFYSVYLEIYDNLVELLEQIEVSLSVSVSRDRFESQVASYRTEKAALATDVRKERQRLITETSSLLRKHQRDPYFLKYPHRREVLANLYFRLTELLYHETSDKFVDELDKYFERLNELSETNPVAARQLIPPRPDYTRVKALYQRLVDEFPTSSYADDALYNIGLLTAESEDQRDKDNANRIFEMLVRIYPDGDYTLNALRRIGEYYFMPPVNNLDKSIEIYTRIADEYYYTDYYVEALYKLGWTYYRFDELHTAVEYFARGLDASLSEEGSKLGEGDALDLEAESINYIGVCFSVEQTDSIWIGSGVQNMTAWLGKHPDRLGKYGPELLLQLGEIYRVQTGQFVKGLEAFNQFIELFPLDYRSVDVQQNIVEIFQQSEIYDPITAHAEKKRYFETYNPDSEWWAANEDPELRKRVGVRLENYVDMYIDEAFVLANDSGNLEDYQRFEHFSRQYLRFWPKGPNAYKIHYNLATVLEKRLDLPTQAMREFWQVATNYPDTANRNISLQRVVAISQKFVERERAGEVYVSVDGEVLPPRPKEPIAAVAPVDTSRAIPDTTEAVVDTSLVAALPDTTAADSLAVTDEMAGGEEAEVTGEPQAIAAVEEDSVEKAEELKITPLYHSEELLLAGFDIFTSNYPTSSLTPTMLYQAGDLLFSHNQLPESRHYFELLIAEHPDSRFIEDAFKYLLNGYFKSEEYADVEAITRRIAESNVSAELKGIANEKKAQSIYLSASSLKKAANHFDAAMEFLRVALDAPDFEHSDKSLFQAGIEFMEADSFARANDAFIRLADNYPQSEHADDALYNVGFNLQSEIKDFAESARIFERLVKEHPRTELAQGALGNASYNYSQVEDHESVIRVNNLYVAKFPAAEDASAYLFENAGHYLKLNQVEKANEIYRRFAERYPDDPRTVQAYFERGKYFLDKGNNAQAGREFTETVNAHERLVAKKLSGSPTYASQALSRILGWEHEKYDLLKLRLPKASLESALDRKKSWRNELTEKYKKLISFGQKEGYRAFYELARLDDELALAVFNQEMPQIKKVADRLEANSEIINLSIQLNDLAANSYREGRQNLTDYEKQLGDELVKRQTEYEEFSSLVTTLQKDTVNITAEARADSLSKLSRMQRTLAELDTAVSEAHKWAETCREQIPEVVSRNGYYLYRLLEQNLEIRSEDRDEEVRMLTRQVILNNNISVLIPEVCGLYLQALITAREVDLYDRWETPLDSAFNATVDILLSQYFEQADVARARIDRFMGQYEEMLPRGEDAQSPDGFYPDEMGGLILDQVDYLNTFSLELLTAFTAVLDTVVLYGLPNEFGFEGKNRALQFILDRYENFDGYASLAKVRNSDYAAKYDETDELHWDDAATAYEDININCSDYGIALLEEGFGIKQGYNVPGIAGINILSKLVELNPAQYASLVGIEAEQHTVVSSPEWLFWPNPQDGFNDIDFIDVLWENPTESHFPFGSDFAAFDTLHEMPVPIWYFIEEPILPDKDLFETTPFDTSDMDYLPGLEGGEEEIDTTLVDTSETGEEDLDALPGLTETDTTEFVASEIDTSEEILPEPVEIPEEEMMSEEELAAIARQDSIKNAWSEIDSLGARKYWFRHSFFIDEKPSAGTAYLTVDDDFDLFINGVYVAADDRDSIDWMDVKNYDVGKYLKEGPNIIAIEAIDVDNSRHGLIAAVVYNTIPDIHSKLEEMKERMLEEEAKIKAKVAKHDTISEVEKKEEMSPEFLRDIRIIEKNKLR